MAAQADLTGQSAASNWLFESFVSSLKENNRNLLWVCGSFLMVSFVTVAFNLGAIDAVRFNAFSIESSLTATWPIRVMLCTACLVAFSAVIYVVLEQQRLQLGLDFLAARQQREAVQIGSFSEWLDANHPRMARAKSLAIGAFVTFCAVVLVIDFVTLVFSFSS